VPAPIVIDALFGTGLSRGLADDAAAALRRLVEAARIAIAVDLPSGLATDDGVVFGDVPRFDLTLALGAVKPSHLLQPAARHCGAVRLVDIGLAADSRAGVLARPDLPEPGPDAHKYTRGMVAIVGGAMRGAALLAATAAMRSGAGYVALLGETEGGPHALVHKPFDDESLGDKRIGALLIGPGLGRDKAAKTRLKKVLATDHPLVIDGDALHLLRPIGFDALAGRAAILTPHAGEFDALFGKGEGSKIERTRAAAAKSGAFVVHKGADTVIAAPDGQVRVAGDANDWLSTAGTGDVLAGAVAAMLASGIAPLDAAAAGVWLHGAAARRLGAAFTADDLADAMTKTRAMR
jgi:ADP-dependent NAD(P)H-hydrate dehydratase / NAD(P)H-hydrate epimerase